MLRIEEQLAAPETVSIVPRVVKGVFPDISTRIQRFLMCRRGYSMKFEDALAISRAMGLDGVCIDGRYWWVR